MADENEMTIAEFAAQELKALVQDARAKANDPTPENVEAFDMLVDMIITLRGGNENDRVTTASELTERLKTDEDAQALAQDEGLLGFIAADIQVSVAVQNNVAALIEAAIGGNQAAIDFVKLHTPVIADTEFKAKLATDNGKAELIEQLMQNPDVVAPIVADVQLFLASQNILFQNISAIREGNADALEWLASVTGQDAEALKDSVLTDDGANALMQDPAVLDAVAATLTSEQPTGVQTSTTEAEAADPMAMLTDDGDPEQLQIWARAQALGLSDYDPSIFAGELDDDALMKNESFLKAAKVLYDMENGEGAWDKHAQSKIDVWTERSQSSNRRVASRYRNIPTAESMNEELGKWALQYTSDLSMNVEEGLEVKFSIEDWTKEQQTAMLFALRAYEHKNMSWVAGTGRAISSMATDKVTWGMAGAGFAAGWVTGGTGWLAGIGGVGSRIVAQATSKIGSSLLVQQLTKNVMGQVMGKVLTSSITRGVFVGGNLAGAEGLSTDYLVNYDFEREASKAINVDLVYGRGRGIMAYGTGFAFGGTLGGLGAGMRRWFGSEAKIVPPDPEGEPKVFMDAPGGAASVVDTAAPVVPDVPDAAAAFRTTQTPAAANDPRPAAAPAAVTDTPAAPSVDTAAPTQPNAPRTGWTGAPRRTGLEAFQSGQEWRAAAGPVFQRPDENMFGGAPRPTRAPADEGGPGGGSPDAPKPKKIGVQSKEYKDIAENLQQALNDFNNGLLSGQDPVAAAAIYARTISDIEAGMRGSEFTKPAKDRLKALKDGNREKVEETLALRRPATETPRERAPGDEAGPRPVPTPEVDPVRSAAVLRTARTDIRNAKAQLDRKLEEIYKPENITATSEVDAKAAIDTYYRSILEAGNEARGDLIEADSKTLRGEIRARMVKRHDDINRAEAKIAGIRTDSSTALAAHQTQLDATKADREKIAKLLRGDITDKTRGDIERKFTDYKEALERVQKSVAADARLIQADKDTINQAIDKRLNSIPALRDRLIDTANTRKARADASAAALSDAQTKIADAETDLKTELEAIYKSVDATAEARADAAIQAYHTKLDDIEASEGAKLLGADKSGFDSELLTLRNARTIDTARAHATIENARIDSTAKINEARNEIITKVRDLQTELNRITADVVTLNARDAKAKAQTVIDAFYTDLNDIKARINANDDITSADKTKIGRVIQGHVDKKHTRETFIVSAIDAARPTGRGLPTPPQRQAGENDAAYVVRFAQYTRDYVKSQLDQVRLSPRGNPDDFAKPAQSGFKIGISQNVADARSIRDFNYHMVESWKKLLADMEAAPDQAARLAAVNDFKATVGTIRDSIMEVEPGKIKYTYRYLAYLNKTMDPVHKLSIIKELDRLADLAKHGNALDEAARNNTFGDFITGLEQRLAQRESTNAAPLLPTGTAHRVHARATNHPNDQYRYALMRTTLQGQDAFSGLQTRQNNIGNGAIENVENLNVEKLLKGLATQIDRSHDESFISTTADFWQAFIDNGEERAFFETHERLVKLLGTNPKKITFEGQTIDTPFSHTDIYDGKKDAILAYLYEKNPNNPDVLAFIMRMKLEVDEYMVTTAGEGNPHVERWIGNTHYLGDKDLRLRSVNEELARRTEWVYSLFQFNSDSPSPKAQTVRNDIFNFFNPLAVGSDKNMYNMLFTYPFRREKAFVEGVLKPKDFEYYKTQGHILGRSQWLYRADRAHFFLHRSLGLDLPTQLVRLIPTEYLATNFGKTGQAVNSFFRSNSELTSFQGMMRNSSRVALGGAVLQGVGYGFEAGSDYIFGDDSRLGYIGTGIGNFGKAASFVSDYNPAIWGIQKPVAHALNTPLPLVGYSLNPNIFVKGAEYAGLDNASDVALGLMYAENPFNMDFGSGDDDEAGTTSKPANVEQMEKIRPFLENLIKEGQDANETLFDLSGNAFIDEDDAERRITDKALKALADIQGLIFTNTTELTAAWANARQEVIKEDRITGVENALVEGLEELGFEEDVAKALIREDLIDEKGEVALKDALVAYFLDPAYGYHKPAYDSPGKSYKISPADIEAALDKILTKQSEYIKAAEALAVRIAAAMEGYAKDRGVRVEDLTDPEIEAAKLLADRVDPATNKPYTEDFLKGDAGKDKRANQLKDVQDKIAQNNQQGAGSGLGPGSGAGAGSGAGGSSGVGPIVDIGKPFSEFFNYATDTDNDGIGASWSQFTNSPYISGPFNWVSNSWTGRNGAVGQSSIGWIIAIVTGLIATPIFKSMLGVSNWPIIGIILFGGIALFTKKAAHAAMTGEAGDGDTDTGGGVGQGYKNFVDAAKNSTIRHSISNDGKIVIFYTNVDDDPELEEVAVINRDGNDTAAIMVKDVENGAPHVAVGFLDLKQATRDAQFAVTGNKFGIILNSKQPDRSVNFDIIDENGRRKSVITINGQAHKLDMLPENEALLELDKFEPVPQ